MSSFLSLTTCTVNETIRRRNEDRKPCVIALMGREHSGKSLFIDSCTRTLHRDGSGGELGSHRNKRSRTREIQETRVHTLAPSGKRVRFVEMPGFQNDPPSDADILRHIAKFLIRTQDESKIAGVVYLHDIKKAHEPSDTAYDVDLVRGIVGEKGYNNLMLIVNKFPQSDEEEPTPPLRAERVESLVAAWRSIDGCGRKLNPSPVGQSAEIINEVISQNAELTLELQRELVEKKLLLRKTRAGQAVAARLEQMFRVVEREEKELAKKRPKSDSELVAAKTRKEALKRELKAWNSSKDNKSYLENWPPPAI